MFDRSLRSVAICCSVAVATLLNATNSQADIPHKDTDARQHWAFVKPARPALPDVNNSTWPRNAIDYFVLARLEREGLMPAPEADRTKLVRRVVLDVTGLPPTLNQLDSDLHASPRGDYYAALVDQMLHSPHYGERMARQWLDASRYADTNGYNSDSHRSVWPWRDWVVRAFNESIPYDQFVIEQLAGDLLPNASVQQKVATGFNRNHIINHEGGCHVEEYRVENVVDRVHATATVFMGLTLKCARCHDHKYDPISQKEFYRFAAFFNSVAEVGQEGPTVDGRSGISRWISFLKPLVTLPDAKQAENLASVQAAIQALAAKPKKAPEEQQKLKDLYSQFDQLQKSTPMAMVMQEMSEPRETFLLIRGEYDQRGEKMALDVPGCLPRFPSDAPANRLGLARWLVDPSHPLTARVAVNRLWQLHFGTGFVKTVEDFGTQGDPPSHPQLLDWLATELIRTGWNIKAIQKLILTSATYRQSSKITNEAYLHDPENRLLARGPRFRMSAEMIRDAALMASGLLNRQIGGPSVRPYQPAGLWKEVDGLAELSGVYEQDHGGALYRRSMYTYWKRGSPPPAMMTFDAPVRETCAMRRSRTNTPLQSLVLLNDPTYVEAARALAERMLTAGGSPESLLATGFRLVTARQPKPAESKVLLTAYREQLARFRQQEDDAAALLGVGESPRNEQFDVSELAAWTTVASIILNLDETLTKG